MLRTCRKAILIALTLLVQSASAQGLDNLRVAFLSDSQDPTWIERFFLKLHHNAEAREMIYRDILDNRPLAVVHLGDMVSSASRDGAWQSIDGFVDSLKHRGIEFHPIPGNHEYFFFPQAGIRNFTLRFPDAPLTGYLMRYGGLAIVLLNSNLARLTDEEYHQQAVWYRSTLRTLDADSSIHFVIVGTHHSPFTNSTIVSPSQEVDTAFVPGYLAAGKTVLFLSGHAHAFEHYQRGGKDFLVMGGGGGLLQPLLTGGRRRYPDLFTQQGNTRMFHYLLCTVSPSRLRVDVRMIKEDFSGFETVASYDFDRGAQEKKTPLP